MSPDRTIPLLKTFTIQMPVYLVRALRSPSADVQEDFDTVIRPSLASIRTAVSFYELQGGSANIIVCDDGLLLLPLRERSQRLEYYQANHIGYVARPAEGENGFNRMGRFKKAGNLNYANAISQAVENAFISLLASYRPISYKREMELYRQALREVATNLPGCFDGDLRMWVALRSEAYRAEFSGPR